MSGPLSEPEVQVPTSRPDWIALLAGPSLWFGHFMAVYLLSEVVCTVDGGDPTLAGSPMTLPALAWAILGGTVVALVVLGWAAWRTQTTRRRLADGGELLGIGLALDALFALGILATGLPAAFLTLC